MSSNLERTRLNQVIKQIKEYEDTDDYLKVDILESLVLNMNKHSKDFEIEDFEFEAPLHYSSTGKTINSVGHRALIDHIELLESIMKEMNANVKPAQKHNESNSNKVFIVHGRDEQAKFEAELLLHRIGLEPIILSLMPNQGMTIIEKFIKYSDVKFALVLLTPDDVGALNEDEAKLLPRARQNVIFELGYFYGKLGRDNVCCVVKSKVEIHSDIAGVVYTSYSNSLDEIKMELYKELAAAGFVFNPLK
ncbi:nucleotide-binding protein [Paenibacillus amylolyticus]|uniref:TIR domain-containing protein n=1 Tax=Paenibacillus amylolyticus TaxID=1451 RepID=UPI003D275A86